MSEVTMLRTQRPSIRLRLRKILGFFERLLFPSFAPCSRCGRPFNRAHPHSTFHSEKRACFCLCEPCWGELSPDERLPYYKQLIRDWESSSYFSFHKDFIDMPWFVMKEQIIAAVKAGK